MTSDPPYTTVGPWSESKTRWLGPVASTQGGRAAGPPDERATAQPVPVDVRRPDRVQWPRVFPSL